MTQKQIASLRRQVREDRNIPLVKLQSRKRVKNLALSSVTLDDYLQQAGDLSRLSARDRRHVLRRLSREYAELGTLSHCFGVHNIRFSKDSHSIGHKDGLSRCGGGEERYNRSKYDNIRLRVCKPA